MISYHKLVTTSVEQLLDQLEELVANKNGTNDTALIMEITNDISAIKREIVRKYKQEPIDENQLNAGGNNGDLLP